MESVVVGISGASGVMLANRTISALLASGYHVDLVMSKSALYVATLELEEKIATPEKYLELYFSAHKEQIRVHAIGDIGAAICSGSYKTKGMLIIPCSMSSVASIALGLSDNCLRRAADVTIKEKRPLTIVFRESPLSQLHLEHLLKLSQLGATILPPLPAWYTMPKSIEDVENFIVGKILESLQIEHTLYKPWNP